MCCKSVTEQIGYMGIITFFKDHPGMLGLIYLVFVNILGFALMGIDKKKAEAGKWRIPEKTLFFVAMIGGSVGSILGMKTFRHKTKHTKFTVGMPAILVFQVMMAVLCVVQIIIRK